MHPTLDGSLQALVGALPAVVPAGTEVEEEIAAEVEKREALSGASQKLEAVKAGLEEALEKLREVLDRLRQE